VEACSIFFVGVTWRFGWWRSGLSYGVDATVKCLNVTHEGFFEEGGDGRTLFVEGGCNQADFFTECSFDGRGNGGNQVTF